MVTRSKAVDKVDTKKTRPGRAATALRLAGATYSEIAETLGYADDAEARLAVERDLAIVGSQDIPGRDRLRSEEAARLERLLRGVWQKAVTPTDPEHLSAVRTALAVVDRHARLLGLDMPIEMIVHNPTTVEIDAWVMGILEQSASGEVIEGDVIV